MGWASSQPQLWSWSLTLLGKNPSLSRVVDRWGGAELLCLANSHISTKWTNLTSSMMGQTDSMGSAHSITYLRSILGKKNFKLNPIIRKQSHCLVSNCVSPRICLCRVLDQACAIQFPGQGSNPSPLHREQESQPLDNQGSANMNIFKESSQSSCRISHKIHMLKA